MPEVIDEPRRANQTLELLRRQIVAGRFAPKTQLPTRRQLLKELGVSPVTLQRALDRLTQEGFVYSKGRGGTYVSDNPPHLSRIAFVFSTTPSNDATQWSLLSRVLTAEAPGLAEHRNRKLSMHYGIDGHADNEDFQLLVQDVRRRRLSGILFGHNPFLLVNTPVLDEPDIPRVAITGKLNVHPSVESVSPDWESFFDIGAEHFAACGRKRVAILLTRPVREYANTAIPRKIASLGLQTRPYWQLVLESPLSIPNCVQLLMNSNQLERPDALLVCSDSWSEHATAGLIAAGVQAPQNLEVVIQCNFPSMGAGVMPFRRLGWDARRMLETAVDLLDAQRETGRLGPGVLLPAVFEDEVQIAAPDGHGTYTH